LIKRTATAILAIPFFLGFLYLGGIFSQALVIILITLALHEYGRLAPAPLYWDYLWITGLSYPLLLFSGAFPGFFPYWFILQMVYYLTRTALTGQNSLAASHHMVVTLYISVFFSFLWLVRNDFGFMWLLFALAVTWLTDTGAYLVGRRFGRSPMAPNVSPKKTWQGAFGGLAAAVVVGALLGAGRLIPLAAVHAAVLAAVLSVCGQIGDLAESSIKREQKIKDSGAILPGHGGILDRFDSLAFVLPILYMILTALVPQA